MATKLPSKLGIISFALIVAVCAQTALAGPSPWESVASPSVSAESYCAQILEGTLEVNRIWPFSSVPRDGVPLGSTRYIKPVDQIDVDLMYNSFSNRIKGQPVESGVIEVLDQDGELLYAPTPMIVTGRVGEVDLRRAIADAFIFASGNSAARTIRHRHSHPPMLGMHPIDYDTWRFSSADGRVNAQIRRLMDLSPSLRHLTLEASIVYLEPKLKSLVVTPSFFSEHCRTVAYRLGPVR